MVDLPRLLVTGGAGFIGSHLCERLLSDGGDVLCVDNYYTGSKNNLAGLLDLHRARQVSDHLTVLARTGTHRNSLRGRNCDASGRLDGLGWPKQGKLDIRVENLEELAVSYGQIEGDGVQ